MTNDRGSHVGTEKESKPHNVRDVGAIIFMIGISFNAGIQYSKIATLEQTAKARDQKIEASTDNRLKISERLTRVEDLVLDIRDELHNKSGGKRQ